MTEIVFFADYRRHGRRIWFDRRELNRLLAVYSRKVAGGIWRDYAIDNRSNMAMFSIYRRSQEQPLFAVHKVLLRGEKEPNYLLIAGKRQLLSSRDLADILDFLDRRLAVVA